MLKELQVVSALQLAVLIGVRVASPCGVEFELFSLRSHVRSRWRFFASSTSVASFCSRLCVGAYSTSSSSSASETLYCIAANEP